jgi:glutamate synthase domain-containing protein 2
MSYGAISKPAVQALSRGSANAGCWINTGEGGLAPWHLEGGGDIVFQIGTAMYGIRTTGGELDEEKLATIAAEPQVKMFEIKLSQGAKPGKGGILPAAKVSDDIAAIRGIPAHKASISPSRFRDVRNASELLDFIDRIRKITGKPTGFKTVVGAHDWLEELCLEILKRGDASAPDFITIDGGDGGSGAAPMSLMDNVGLQIQESLPLIVDLLEKHGLRHRIRVVAGGKLINSTEVAWALAAGADAVNTARGFMFALGCIQAMRCNTNTCPTGITTHNPRLQSGLDSSDKAVKVENYVKTMIKDVCTIAQACGVTEPNELRRRHCHIVMSDGRTKSFAELRPRFKPVPGSTPQN